MSEPMPFLLALMGAYLSGSVPYAWLIGRARGVDLRLHGSKNVGATNCGRVLGRGWGILAFVCDMLKGLIPVWLAGVQLGWAGHADLQATEAWMWLAVVTGAVVGHVFPVWLKFRGGKGVATGFGAVLGVWPFLTLPALGALMVWLILLVCFRVVGPASVFAAVAMPLWVCVQAWWWDWPLDLVWPFGGVTLAVAVLIVVRHRSNLVKWLGRRSIPTDASDPH